MLQHVQVFGWVGRRREGVGRDAELSLAEGGPPGVVLRCDGAPEGADHLGGAEGRGGEEAEDEAERLAGQRVHRRAGRGLVVLLLLPAAALWLASGGEGVGEGCPHVCGG